VTETVRADNERQDSGHNRYLIDPRAYDRIERAADQRRLQVLGIYHSHPDGPARPSEFDCSHAWPELLYLIVSVVKGHAASTHSWRLRADGSQFDEEPVEIVDQPTTIRK